MWNSQTSGACSIIKGRRAPSFFFFVTPVYGLRRSCSIRARPVPAPSQHKTKERARRARRAALWARGTRREIRARAPTREREREREGGIFVLVEKRKSVVESRRYGRYPVTIDRGVGCELFDDGADRRYLDFVAGIATCCLGHADARMVSSLRRLLAQKRLLLLRWFRLLLSSLSLSLSLSLGRAWVPPGGGGHSADFARPSRLESVLHSRARPARRLAREL